MDDPTPIRRSLRVAGMTPMRPKNTIAHSNNSSPTRNQSRSNTPSKSRAPDSRARQTMNLPSDISSSDFLGDTPTARFHRRATGKQSAQYMDDDLERTIVAQRVQQSHPYPQSTLKANRLRTLTQDSEESDEGSSGVFKAISLSFRALFRWFLGEGKSRLTDSFGIIKICIGVAATVFSILFFYALLQVDWNLAGKLGEGLVREDQHFDTKSPLKSSNQKELLSRLYQLENEVSNLKYSMGSVEESFKTGLNHLVVDHQTLRETISLLERSIRAIQTEIKEAAMATDQMLRSDLDKATASLYKEIENLKADFDKEQLIRQAMEEILPEKLLIRKNKDESIFIDPKVIKMIKSAISFQTLPKMESTTMPGAKASDESAAPSIHHGGGGGGERDDKDSSAAYQESLKKEIISENQQAIEELISGRLSNLEHKIVEKKEIVNILASSFKTHKKSIEEAQEERLSSFLTESDLDRVFKDFTTETLLFSDIIGMADFAQISMGSRIIPGLTSPTFNSNGLLGDIFGPRAARKSPKVALSPDNSLGNCWAMKGQSGQITIALGSPIIPSHFSLDHVPRALVEDRSSAPRQISFFGHSRESEDKFLLGTYEYSLEKSAIQTFPIQYIPKLPLARITMLVKSNHGNADFTCIYRVRVHSTKK